MLDVLKLILEIQELDIKMIRLMRIKRERLKELEQIELLLAYFLYARYFCPRSPFPTNFPEATTVYAHKQGICPNNWSQPRN